MTEVHEQGADAKYRYKPGGLLNAHTTHIQPTLLLKCQLAADSHPLLNTPHDFQVEPELTPPYPQPGINVVASLAELSQLLSLHCLTSLLLGFLAHLRRHTGIPFISRRS